jgi:1-acyl-sn-glycerol-3-phosphate acyltransferase
MSEADFRYAPFPDLDLPLAARLGQYPRQPDLFLDVARAIGRRATAAFFRAQFRIEVVGAVPALPRLALMPNHASHLDTLALLAVLRERDRARITVLAAKDYFFERPLPALTANLLGQAVAFDRRAGHAELRRWVRLLDVAPDGWFLAYPSGSRKRAEAHAGLAVVLARAGWPVLPVAIAGTAEAWPPGRPLWHPFRRLRLTFGEPIVDIRARALVDLLEAFWGDHGRLESSSTDPNVGEATT